jgi:hypothetical protein
MMELTMFSCRVGFRNSYEEIDARPARALADKEDTGVLNLGNGGGAAVVSKKRPSGEIPEGSVGDVAGLIMQSSNESEASNASVESPKDSGAILRERIQELETSLESMTPQEALEVLIFIKSKSKGAEREVVKGFISNLNRFLLMSSIFSDQIDSNIKNATLSRLNPLLCLLLMSDYKPAGSLLVHLRETLSQTQSKSTQPIQLSKFTAKKMDEYLDKEVQNANNPEFEVLVKALRKILDDCVSMVNENKKTLVLEFCKKEINSLRLKEGKTPLNNIFKDLGKGIPASEAEALDQAKETLKEFLIKDPNLLRKVYRLPPKGETSDELSSFSFQPISETEALRREENPQSLRLEDFVSLLRFVQLKEGHQDYEEIIELSAHLERSEEEVAMTAFSLLEKRPTLWREMTFSPQDNRLFFTEEEFKNIQLLTKVRKVVTFEDFLRLGSEFYIKDAELLSE